jgi:hypothetical protein
VIALLLVLLTAAAAGAEAPATWTTRRPIVLPPVGERAFVEVILDAVVYDGAMPTLGDLRVRERGGAEVGYVVRRLELTRRERDVSLLNLVTTPARQTRFTLDLGARPGAHAGVRLRLDPKAENFRVPVRIETSADGVTWDVARAAGFIYDVAGETRAADTTVSYPVSSSRWLRVTLEPAGDAPLPVRGATVLLPAAAAEREEDAVPATIVERTREAGRKVSRIVVDLGGRRPVDRVELDVADRNFHRVVTFETSDDRQQWRWAGSGAVSALDTPRLKERETRARLAETTARYLRLTVHDQDDRPLEITGVRAAGVRRSVAFEAVAGREYVLDYGNPRAAAPHHDVERTVRALAGQALPRATLGPAAPIPPPARPPWLDGQPIVMWGAMAVAVVALGLLLARLMRGVRPA